MGFVGSLVDNPADGLGVSVHDTHGSGELAAWLQQRAVQTAGVTSPQLSRHGPETLIQEDPSKGTALGTVGVAVRGAAVPRLGGRDAGGRAVAAAVLGSPTW